MNLKRLSGLQYDLLAVACLTLLAFSIYGNTYHVTWYFDDIGNITLNGNVYAFANPLRTLLSPRGPAILSFALNYALHGESLPGYHLFNIITHVMVSAMVYLVLKRVTYGNRTLAFIGALVFVAHPIQTQAVTYIVQRMTSLAALFAFLCLYCFIRGRELLATEGVSCLTLRHVFWYLAMFVSCVLAIMTKQNTAFLPLGLYVFGRYFLDENQGWSRRRSIAYLIPFIVLPFLVAYPILIVPMLRGVPLSEIASIGSTISPVRYFVSEWQVLLVYIRLLFVPLGQTLDYAYPLVSELVSITTVLCGSLIAILLYIAYRVRSSAGYVSFAIVWFFLTLMVESSFIPLDLLFEHRLYMPMFGFAVMFIWLIRLIPQERYRVILVSVLIALYSLLTVQRNTLWADPVAFNEDNLRKAPHNERMYVELSRLYIEQTRYAMAEDMLKKGLLINPRSAKLHDNLGVLYYLRGEQERAIEVLKRGITFNPDYGKLCINLAVVYSSRSEYNLAELWLRRAAIINPTDAAAHYNLGVVYYKMGNRERSVESFQSALAHAPYNTDVMLHLANTAFEAGNSELATSVLKRLQALDPAKAAELQQRFP